MIATSMLNLFTDDVESAVVFYRDHLGFIESSRFPPQGRPDHVVLRLGSSVLALSTLGAISSAGLRPSRGQPFELVVWVEDVDQETARLTAAGAIILVQPYAHVGGHRRAYLADPVGNWVALVDAPSPAEVTR